jgi:hypothetical protein
MRDWGVFCKTDRHSRKACAELDPVAGIQQSYFRLTRLPAPRFREDKLRGYDQKNTPTADLNKVGTSIRKPG